MGETAAAGGAAAATPDKVNGTVKTQLIAHDQEVYDIAFKPDTTNEFASVGADGSVRLFDLRDLKHSKIIHETENGKALLRLAWNRQEKPCNYLAVLEMDTQTVTVLDTRVPMQPLATLKGHSNRINGELRSIRACSHAARGQACVASCRVAPCPAACAPRVCYLPTKLAGDHLFYRLGGLVCRRSCVGAQLGLPLVYRGG